MFRKSAGPAAAAHTPRVLLVGCEGEMDEPMRSADAEALCVPSLAAAAAEAEAEAVHVVVARLEREPTAADVDAVRALRAQSRQTFVAVVAAAAAENAPLREALSAAGASMYSASLSAAAEAAGRALRCFAHETGPHRCPFCEFSGSDDGLWAHMPLHHIGERNVPTDPCPICRQRSREPVQVHVHTQHGPVGRGELPGEDSTPQELAAFALVVVRRPADGKFLVVQEFASSGFWLPGGRVDPGETLQEAALRETEEEADVRVRLTGVLALEFTPQRFYSRLRAVFLAEPEDARQLPKSTPCYESMGACWVSRDELLRVSLRGPEPEKWFAHVEAGGAVSPMGVLSDERSYSY